MDVMRRGQDIWSRTISAVAVTASRRLVTLRLMKMCVSRTAPRGGGSVDDVQASQVKPRVPELTVATGERESGAVKFDDVTTAAN